MPYVESHAPGSFFQSFGCFSGFGVCARFSSNIDSSMIKLHAQACCQPPCKLQIAVRFSPAKSVVQMRRAQHQPHLGTPLGQDPQ